MPTEMDPQLGELIFLGRSWATGCADIIQRVVIIFADLVLIVLAVVALGKDWTHTCDETLHLYGFLCVVLCFLDLIWEFVRCTLESALDRMQSDFQPDAPAIQGNDSLLGDSSPYGEGIVGTPSVDARDIRDVSPSVSASISGGAIGRGIRKEKAMKKKRTADLQFWSLVFTCFVSIVFSFFSAHDLECAEHAPDLYNYIHTFTYVFIFRLGAIILWICCRTVKNYEDAAQAAGGIARQPPQQGQPMRNLVF